MLQVDSKRCAVKYPGLKRATASQMTLHRPGPIVGPGTAQGPEVRHLGGATSREMHTPAPPHPPAVGGSSNDRLPDRKSVIDDADI